jgi:hypothetical protein
MPTVIAIPARKRLAWHAWLDMPVGLMTSPVVDAEPAGHILLLAGLTEPPARSYGADGMSPEPAR